MNKTTNVLIDIETFSKEKNAVIVSIGAVKFNEQEILDKFYVNIDPVSCKSHGLVVSADTVAWWKEQDPKVLAALKVDQKDLITALDMFSEWFGPKSIPTWGNAPSFDCVILEHAYKAIGKLHPWKYYDERCFRTVCAIFGISHKNNRTGDLHNALDDAISEVHTLQSLFNKK